MIALVETGLGDKPLRRVAGADTFTPLAGAFLVAQIVAAVAEVVQGKEAMVKVC